jgi:hypothetical protein
MEAFWEATEPADRQETTPGPGQKSAICRKRATNAGDGPNLQAGGHWFEPGTAHPHQFPWQSLSCVGSRVRRFPAAHRLVAATDRPPRLLRQRKARCGAFGPLPPCSNVVALALRLATLGRCILARWAFALPSARLDTEGREARGRAVQRAARRRGEVHRADGNHSAAQSIEYPSLPDGTPFASRRNP